MGVAHMVLTALWLMLPAYLANMLPVFVGGGMPIDLRKNWKDGHRILGDGKTWRGLLVAPLLAAALTGILQWLVDSTAWGAADGYAFPGWGAWPLWFVLAYALGFGALAGDAIESFFKRRTGRLRGERWIPFDQLDFVVGGLVFAFLAGWIMSLFGAPNVAVEIFTLERVTAIVLLTPALHLLVNFIGYKIGAKDVPW